MAMCDETTSVVPLLGSFVIVALIVAVFRLLSVPGVVLVCFVRLVRWPSHLVPLRVAFPETRVEVVRLGLVMVKVYHLD